MSPKTKLSVYIVNKLKKQRIASRATPPTGGGSPGAKPELVDSIPHSREPSEMGDKQEGVPAKNHQWCANGPSCKIDTHYHPVLPARKDGEPKKPPLTGALKRLAEKNHLPKLVKLCDRPTPETCGAEPHLHRKHWSDEGPELGSAVRDYAQEEEDARAEREKDEFGPWYDPQYPDEPHEPEFGGDARALPDDNKQPLAPGNGDKVVEMQYVPEAAPPGVEPPAQVYDVEFPPLVAAGAPVIDPPVVEEVEPRPVVVLPVAPPPQEAVTPLCFDALRRKMNQMWCGDIEEEEKLGDEDFESKLRDEFHLLLAPERLSCASCPSQRRRLAQIAYHCATHGEELPVGIAHVHPDDRAAPEGMAWVTVYYGMPDCAEVDEGVFFRFAERLKTFVWGTKRAANEALYRFPTRFLPTHQKLWLDSVSRLVVGRKTLFGKDASWDLTRAKNSMCFLADFFTNVSYELVDAEVAIHVLSHAKVQVRSYVSGSTFLKAGVAVARKLMSDKFGEKGLLADLGLVGSTFAYITNQLTIRAAIETALMPISVRPLNFQTTSSALAPYKSASIDSLLSGAPWRSPFSLTVASRY